MNYVLIFYTDIKYNECIIKSRSSCAEALTEKSQADDQAEISVLWLVRGENRNCREKRGKA